MISPETPILDPGDAQELHQQLAQLLPAYTPEFAPLGPGNVEALLRITARYSAIIAERLNQAPDKNKLAFLDLLGISLLPALPAIAPLVFEPLPLAEDTRIQAGTRAGVTPPGASKPIFFETEQTVAMAAAKLTDVFSLWPDRDGFHDHSADIAGGRAFTLFRNPDRIEHVLYLAHNVLLAIKGKATVDVAFDLSTAGNKALELQWQHWDGQVWRPFGDSSVDGTGGLTRSGTARLSAVCGDSELTTVANISNHWIRAFPKSELPPQTDFITPMVESIRLRTTIIRPVIGAGSTWTGITPDGGWADSSKLNFSATFYPMGKTPTEETIFYLQMEELLTKAGAFAQIAITQASTPEQEADKLAAKFELDVNNARTELIAVARQACLAALDASKGIAELNPGPFTLPALITAQNKLGQALSTFGDPKKIKDLAPRVLAVSDALAKLVVDLRFVSFPPPIGTIPDVVATETDMQKARDEVANALKLIQNSLTELGSIGPVPAAAGGGSPIPKLADAKLVWEYFDGTSWRVLVAPSGTAANNLLASGVFGFTVPADLEPYEIEGTPARVIRARVVSGSYNELQMISWFDPDAMQINFIPVIKPRPPALSGLVFGYSYKSAWQAPQRCLARNDFQWEHHTADVDRPGSFFAPFRPVAETAPALYIGFDRALPNDLVSLYLDIVESSEPDRKLLWDVWNGTAWVPVKVDDSTAGLRRPGMVSFLSPFVAPRKSAAAQVVSGGTVTTPGPLAAGIFASGDKVVLINDKHTEAATVARVQDSLVILEGPAAEGFNGGTLEQAALARFGTSRDWLRARQAYNGPPEFTRVKGIYLNAVWSRQIETINGETLGNGQGRLNQSMFFNRFPVLPGEEVEIRELEGARAEVEYPILREQLLDKGMPEDVLRVVTDPRTNKVKEVWVRWTGQPHLYFSGPDDRHYVLERARGRIHFGNARNGKLPTPGNNNIRARKYRTGGGIDANVGRGEIKQMLSGAPTQSVFNPAPAMGGANGELLSGVMWRGPQVTRHRGRALSAADYEALAREASPGVALARALPATAPNLRPAPGWVTLIVVPQSTEPRPTPSYEFRKLVADYLAARAPLTVDAPRITVIGPTFHPVSVNAAVAPRVAGDASVVRDAVSAALAKFFHPLTGGPNGRGWELGRDVWISDVAALLESIPGVDYVQRLQISADGIPSGDTVRVPGDRIVVAGVHSIEMIQGRS